jgi:hypothetical protein
MRFVVDRVALGERLLRVLRFSPVTIISPGLHIHISSVGWPQFEDSLTPPPPPPPTTTTSK